MARRIIVALATTALVAPAVATAPANAAGTVRSAVSLTAPTSGVYGSSINLTGIAWRYGTSTRLVNATIWLQRSVHGKNTWSNLKSTRTSSTGAFAFSVQQVTAYDYRAYYGGSPTYTANVSAVRYPAVLQKASLYLFDANWELGTLVASTNILPMPPSGTTIWLQRFDAATKVWKNYISGKATGRSSNVVIRGNVPGSVGTYRVYAPSRYPYAHGYSANRTYAHYKWRGVFAKPLLATGGEGNPAFDVLPAAEDPYRAAAEAFADLGGTVWADINTSGCVVVEGYTGTDTAGQTTVRVLNGSYAGRTVTVTATDFDEGRPIAPWNITGISRLRLQVTNTGSTTDTYAWLEVRARCAS
jgi:hypothetical protein